MSEENKPTYLTVKEVSQLLRLSKMTIYREIKDRNLPHIIVGKSIRIHRDDVADYLVGRYVAAATEENK